MKTILLTLGLLLLAISCCNAMPRATHYSTSPGSCCFKFSEVSIPAKRVTDIARTHSSCQNRAFIVKTVKGRQICYRETFQWAADLYNKIHKTEGSGFTQ